ncbi:MerR family transcriptional regulator [Microbacterium ulmi]|uniref:MerR family transcriptional regulator n=1 Tax=Microbacterium ulmi TaxID=179095 RepID=A0A7Y2M268_9MICO|nr:MerR family transcriptional regulator [Microbacterium ulmi]NII69431.1 DNA-binding transcriptional MerR regulator [Microbacterium ulmi]NNH04389.1 MerR family transcriptional regulator [Microbacterium ulmi]
MMGVYDGTMSIGELSARTGASVRALRYYEQHRLLDARRTSAGHRRFSEDAVETVRRVRLFLEAGLPLAVVSQIMPCFIDDGERLDACVSEYLRDHLGGVQARIDELDKQQMTVARLQRLVVA